MCSFKNNPRLSLHSRWEKLQLKNGLASVKLQAFAFLMIFERFVFNYLTTLPPGITEDLYLVYGLQSLVVVGTFVVGILLVPSLTSSIFSGQGGQSTLPDRIRLS